MGVAALVVSILAMGTGVWSTIVAVMARNDSIRAGRDARLAEQEARQIAAAAASSLQKAADLREQSFARVVQSERKALGLEVREWITSELGYWHAACDPERANGVPTSATRAGKLRAILGKSPDVGADILASDLIQVMERHLEQMPDADKLLAAVFEAMPHVERWVDDPVGFVSDRKAKAKPEG